MRRDCCNMVLLAKLYSAKCVGTWQLGDMYTAACVQINIIQQRSMKKRGGPVESWKTFQSKIFAYYKSREELYCHRFMMGGALKETFLREKKANTLVCFSGPRTSSILLEGSTRNQSSNVKSGQQLMQSEFACLVK